MLTLLVLWARIFDIVSRFFPSMENKGVLPVSRQRHSRDAPTIKLERIATQCERERGCRDDFSLFSIQSTFYIVTCSLTALQIGDEYRCLISFLLRARLIFLGSRRSALLSCSADREPAPVSELREREREREGWSRLCT